MPHEYTFLLLNASMRAVRRMDMVCLNDADALALAEIIRERNHLEVWDGRRRVAVLDSHHALEPEVGEPIDKVHGAEPEITFVLDDEALAVPRPTPTHAEQPSPIAASISPAVPAPAPQPAEPVGAPIALFKRLAGARGS
jgi:hypothetical protein